MTTTTPDTICELLERGPTNDEVQKIGHAIARAAIAALQAVPAASEVGVRELVDAVGETLDKDFGFWSSPTQSERRSRLYNAWKAVSATLNTSASLESTGK